MRVKMKLTGLDWMYYSNRMFLKIDVLTEYFERCLFDGCNDLYLIVFAKVVRRMEERLSAFGSGC